METLLLFIHLLLERIAECSLGIGDRRILRLLHRILWLKFASFPREVCPSIIILLLLYCILLFLRFLMKTLELLNQVQPEEIQLAVRAELELGVSRFQVWCLDIT